jgi:DNA-3-methyladenine glycosylase II
VLQNTPPPSRLIGMRFPPGKKTKLPFDSDMALVHVSRRDKKMSRLIEQVGAFRLELEKPQSPFEALSESIVYQQLTGKAAATIYGRLKDVCAGSGSFNAETIDSLPEDALRSVGLSRAKTAALRDLAAKTIAGEIPSFKQLQSMTDDEIVTALTNVRGIGRWTVEMLLIFGMGRPDILPVNDYGIRKGFALTYRRKGELPTPAELMKFGEKWRPFRTVASWYLWRANDL